MKKSMMPSGKPVLRIETGRHSAQIRRIAADSAGRWLVSASVDKTVRVWEIPSPTPNTLSGIGELRLLHTIRPPIGPGNEGKLYAVALSPDGCTIACSGWTWFSDGSINVPPEGGSIYLFNRSSGSMTGRIAGLPNVINHLAFSNDGSYLVAALGVKQGIRLYRTSTWSIAGKDREYGSDSHSAHFSRDGRLVTTCLDGYIRLYDVVSGSLRLIARVRAPGGCHPYSARFSPDGSKVAVGYERTTNISVLSGYDLALLYTPDTSAVRRGNLMSVAWSQDGRTLFAGGKWGKQTGDVWKIIICSWTDSGRSGFRETALANNGIMDLITLQEGRVAYGTAGPAIGLLDQWGEHSIYIPAATADFRNNWDGFLLSGDSGTVGFSFEALGKCPATFFLGNRSLTFGKAASTLVPPITSAFDLEITDWKDSFQPKLNGNALKLDENECSRSLAIIPHRGSFILGTEWSLRYFDRHGKKLWMTSIPTIAWAVNVVGNASVAVAAFGDGTIRWYRIKDGKELLAFFPHADKKRWIVWTPSGYYDASVGGEDLIGWHINRGKDKAADFFPASHFRDVYYRPDIVAKVLSTLDEAEAVLQANAVRGVEKGTPTVAIMLPPVIEILEPAEGSMETSSQIVTLRYRVRSPADAPVSKVKTIVNTRPVLAQKGGPVTTGEKDVWEITVTVPEEDCEIALIAENRNAFSVPATVRILWRGNPPATTTLPRLLILAVGIADYEDKSLKLDYPPKDANDFVNAFKNQEGLVYSEVIHRVVTDPKAKKDDILNGLEWLKEETTNCRDIATIFLAGHGTNDRAGLYYFCPQNIDSNKLTLTGVELSTIRNIVANLPCVVLLFLDTCHSGSADVSGIINTFVSSEVGAVVFASSMGNQSSLESNKWQNGAFTKALVEGLYGKADYTGKGKITITSLGLYVSDRVKELTMEQQTPVVGKPTTIADFEIARRREGIH